MSRDLEQRDGSARHGGIVIGHTGGTHLPIARAVVELVILAHRLCDEPERLHGGSLPVGTVQAFTGIRDGVDHETVPVRKHLVVTKRLRPLVTVCEELFAQRIQLAFLHRRKRQRHAQTVHDVLAFPVARSTNVVDLLEQRSILAKHRVDLGFAPRIELAFFAFGVGVKRRRKAAAFGHHLAQDPTDSVLDPRPIGRIAAVQPDHREHVDQQRIVVQHLLEVRDKPDLIDRVAREATTQVIIDAALAHVGERQVDGLLELRKSGVGIRTPHQLDDRHVRELRCARQSAVEYVELLAEALHGRVQCHRIKLRAWPVGLEHALQACADGLRILRDLFAVLAIQPRDFLQHVLERRLAELGFGRKVRAAPVWIALRRQEHGQRPATLFAHHVERRLENGVQVRPLFAVDLDVDEELVHQRGSCRIFKALVGHHVAPVAGGVADGHEDRFAGRVRFLERLGTPHLPVDRIVFVLKQVRARRLREQVHGNAVLPEEGKTEDEKLCCIRLPTALRWPAGSLRHDL